MSSPIEKPERLNAPGPHIYGYSVATALPHGWDRNLEELIAEQGTSAGPPGSCSPGADRNIDGTGLTVIQGETLTAQVPWLLQLYHGPILDLANGLGLGQFVATDETTSELSLQRYTDNWRFDWHLERSPMVVLLAANHLPPLRGGALAYRPDPQDFWKNDNIYNKWVSPAHGELTLFDLRRVPHSITPPLAGLTRLFAVMQLRLAEARDEPDDGDPLAYDLPVRPWSEKLARQWNNARAREDHGLGQLKKLRRRQRGTRSFPRKM